MKTKTVQQPLKSQGTLCQQYNAMTTSFSERKTVHNDLGTFRLQRRFQTRIPDGRTCVVQISLICLSPHKLFRNRERDQSDSVNGTSFTIQSLPPHKHLWAEQPLHNSGAEIRSFGPEEGRVYLFPSPKAFDRIWRPRRGNRAKQPCPFCPRHQLNLWQNDDWSGWYARPKATTEF